MIYLTGDTSYSVTSGNIFIESYSGDNVAGVEADANTYLANVINGTWLANASDTVEQLLPSPLGANNQTLIYLANTSTGTTQGTTVPEHESLALLATGLVGFAALRRRRVRG